MGIMATINLVLHSGNVNCGTMGTFLNSNVNSVILFKGAIAYKGKGHGESGYENGFAMINMANHLNVDIEFFLLKFVVSSTNSESVSTKVNVDDDNEIGCKERMKKGGGEVRRR
ncbi:hypothetical protein SLA2020_201930 [Shorea laevis]